MKKQHIIISLVIFIFLLLNFVFKPYLQRREASRIIETVLQLWQKGDLPSTFDYWEKAQKAPPVYELTSFHIQKKNL